MLLKALHFQTCAFKFAPVCLESLHLYLQLCSRRSKKQYYIKPDYYTTVKDRLIQVGLFNVRKISQIVAKQIVRIRNLTK
ncbi:predicted protein [Methanosarcina acetivorans C2A]|uniref:Uncharacterized protein n=1 Tax=Methanosarcina acetivorans (strain ATCC 35395 / DSM 2834 / JCM 12185 / C2A) TaxID=188937 RepID=Q8TK01_METAC|nr:predicted protein [Methanosarcina acetivorans C2A]